MAHSIYQGIPLLALSFSLTAFAAEQDTPVAVTAIDTEEIVDSTSSLTLESMAVTAVVEEAKLGGIDIRALPLASTIINQDEINRLKFVDPDELLDRIPGETLVRNLRIPQGGKSYTIPLIDGVALGSPLSGATQDFGTDISAQDIQRIEILKGPVSALYHNNALGGVINVISKGSEQLPEQNTRLWAEFGNYDRYRGGGSTQGTVEGIGYIFDYSTWDIGAYRDQALVESLEGDVVKEAGQDRHQASAKFIFHPDEVSSFIIRGSYLNDAITTPGELFESEFDADDEQIGRSNGSFEDVESYLGSFIYNRNILEDGNLTVDFVYRYTEETGDSVRGGLFDDEDTDINGKVTYKHDFDFLDSNIIFGTDIYYGINDDINPSATASRVSYDYATTGIYSGFAQLQFSPIQDVEITAGVRHETIELEIEQKDSGGKESNDKTYHKTLPKVGITYDYLENHRIWAAYGEGFLVPTTGQLFTSRTHNPDLDPEQARHYEIGLRGLLPIFGADLVYDTSYYYQDITDFIVTTETGPNSSEILNAGKVNIQGVETVLEYQPTDFIRFGITHTFASNIYKEFIDSSGRDLAGEELSRSPEHHVNGRVAIMPYEGLAIELGVDSTTSYSTRDFSSEDPKGRFDRDERINLRVTYDQGPLELWFHALNIGDVKEDRVGFSPGPRGPDERSIRTVDGLQLYGGFAYNF